jgi:hypothetical protein
MDGPGIIAAGMTLRKGVGGGRLLRHRRFIGVLIVLALILSVRVS